MEILVHLSKLSQIHVLKANLFPKEIPFTLLDVNLALQCFVLFPIKERESFFDINTKRKNPLLKE